MTEQVRPPGEPEPTIVVIDDEPANLQIIKMAVVREQFRCNLVLLDSARKGLEFIERHPTDLLLLDVVMPGMNGFEMFAALKADPRWADLPVIFLSAVNEPQYIIQGLEMGAVDYIGKPLISQVLTARFRSVLRMKYLQSELRKRNQELENANRLKDEFLSFCSHDLRAPISAIEMTCQFLTDQLAEAQGAATAPEETEELLGRIVNQTRLARRLVENLLDMNKIEEGRVVPQPTFFSPRELLRGCVRDHQPMILARNLAIEEDLHAEDIVCFGDREMIAQAVRNLLGNAVKFARKGIRVHSRIEGAQSETGGFWHFEIVDDGMGIPPGEEETIFNKYAKSDLRGAGYGLGLYIAQQTVRLHHGTISARSQPTEETTVAVHLPHAFLRDALPDLSAASHATVRILSGSRDLAELLETILLEGGLMDVSPIVAEGNPLDAIAASAPDLAIVHLSAESVDLLRLVRMVSSGDPPIRWMLVGLPEELGQLGRHVTASTALLELPVNPIVCLRRIQGLWSQPGRALFAAH